MEPSNGDAQAPAPREVPTARHSLGLSSSVVFLVSLAGQVIGYAASVVLYRNVGLTGSGKALLGTIQLFLLIATSINTTADLRLGSAFLFFLSRGEKPTTQTGTYLAMRLASVGIVGTAIAVLAPLSIAGARLAPDGTFGTLALFLVLPLLWSVPTVYNQLWVGLGDSVRAQLPTLVETCVRTPALIVAALFDPTLEGLALAYVAGAAVSAIVALPSVTRRVQGIRLAELRRMYRFAAPLMGSMVLSYLASTSLPLVVTATVGVVALNVFNLANGYRILALSLPNAISVPLFPHIAGLHARRRFDELRQQTAQALRYTTMIVVPVLVALVAYRANILNILANATYVPLAALPLAILAVSVLPSALSQIGFTALIGVGYRRLELYISGLQIAALFGTAFLLLPPVGLFSSGEAVLGAAVAQLVAALVGFGANAWFVHRILRIAVRPRSVLGIVVSAAAAFFAIGRLNSILPVNRYYQLLLGLVLGVVVYTLVLAAIGELSRDDVEAFGHSIHVPKRLWGAVQRLCWRRHTPDGVAPLPEADLPRLLRTELPEVFAGTTELPPVEVPPNGSEPALKP